VRAFTLIEMILRGVSAIVLVAINAVLFSGLHLREVTRPRWMKHAPGPALTILRRDLQCAVPPETQRRFDRRFQGGM